MTKQEIIRDLQNINCFKDRTTYPNYDEMTGIYDFLISSGLIDETIKYLQEHRCYKVRKN